MSSVWNCLLLSLHVLFSYRTAILESLIMCGARTCGPKKLGCVSGCVNEAMVGLLKVWFSLIDWTIVFIPSPSSLQSSSSSLESDGARASSTGLSSQDYPDSVEVDHPIRDFTQKVNSYFLDSLLNSRLYRCSMMASWHVWKSWLRATRDLLIWWIFYLWMVGEFEDLWFFRWVMKALFRLVSCRCWATN